MTRPHVEVISVNLEESKPLLELSVLEENRLIETKRWGILSLFALVGCLQGIIWITFTASPNMVKETYSWENLSIDPDEQISLLLNWGPIMFLVTVPVVMLVVVRGGQDNISYIFSLFKCMFRPGVWWMVLFGAIFAFLGLSFFSIRKISFGNHQAPLSD